MRDLRNDTSGLLRRADAGEEIVITVRGRPVAALVPIRESRRRWVAKTEIIRRLRLAQADPGMRDDVERVAGDTTDDLGPIK